jgi:hypothetical protein
LLKSTDEGYYLWRWDQGSGYIAWAGIIAGDADISDLGRLKAFAA